MIADEPIALRRAEIAREEGRLCCEHCGETIGVERNSRNCSYVYPNSHSAPGAVEGDAGDPNYATLCATCWEKDEEYWAEMWREYWSGRL